MRHPWVNTALLALLLVQLITGLAGLMSGQEGRAWVLWAHGMGAYAVVVLLVWKGAVIVHAFRRRRRIASVSGLGFLTLAGLLLVILATGFLWTYGGRRYLGPYSLMVVHGVLAVALLVLFVWHVWARRFILHAPRARDRRAALRLGAGSLVGVALWWAAQPARVMLGLPGAARRFTGSYETGSYSRQFPEVSWLFDFPAPVASDDWRLLIDGAVERPLSLSYSELMTLAQDQLEATLDCTGGWFTTQRWQGLALARLLALAGVQPGARSVSVEAVSGYGRKFALDAAQGYLLAAAVAGAPLSHGHGFPLRLVAPGQRGYAWVKWVTRIHVSATSPLLQPPLPLQ